MHYSLRASCCPAPDPQLLPAGARVQGRVEEVGQVLSVTRVTIVLLCSCAMHYGCFFLVNALSRSDGFFICVLGEHPRKW